MKIALMPLDERPVNTRYPRMIAAIAGVEITLPPPDVLPTLRQPGDAAGLGRWLLDQAGHAALIVSLEMLTSGGLIASRITDEPIEALLGRLAVLRDARQSAPGTRIYGFNVITRIPDADNAIEEPPYWADYGRTLHRYSQLTHRAAAGQPVDSDRAALRQRIPDAVHADVMGRRLRNHLLNLRLLDLAAHDLFDLLVISSDDTSEYGLGTQEKAWVATWAQRLELDGDAGRLLMYPGADEVGCVLLARALLDGHAPTFYVDYAIDADRQRIAPYEDSPIHVTVERQIRALGGTVTDDPAAAAYVVAVNTPSAIGQEYDAEAVHFAAEHARRAPYLVDFVRRIAGWVEGGRQVIMCDVAYPNGSDPDLIGHLLNTVDLRRLAAYGAWNTAGNTVGVALAQGVAASLATTPAQHMAQQRFLLHRFIEDWGYQHLTRAQVRDWLEATTGVRDTVPDNEAEAINRIHAELTALLPRLGALAAGWRITDVRLPWSRTFEIDFDLERQP